VKTREPGRGSQNVETTKNVGRRFRQGRGSARGGGPVNLRKLLKMSKAADEQASRK
jgi:hypothetical protein